MKIITASLLNRFWTNGVKTELDKKANSANPVFTDSISMGRKGNTDVGTSSVAIGSMTIAAGNCSHAEGSNTNASGSYSHAEGLGAGASGSRSHAEGSNTKASGTIAHAEGKETIAAGNCSHAEGSNTNASGSCSHAGGYSTVAGDFQYTIGMHNNSTTATAPTSKGATNGTALVIGNGSSSSSVSNAFRVTYNGATYAGAAYNASGADYAEYAEWADGNPNNEDRRGYFVTFDEEKTTMIRKANAGDYILGVVSGNPCIIGNSDEQWLGRYIRDEFGSAIYEDDEVEETYIDEETGEEKTRLIPVTFYKENPEYNPDKPYVNRESRKEWSAVGWIGVLSVRDDGTCVAGGYCTVADGGIATAAERSTDTYRVLERVTDNVVKVVIK